MPGLVNTPLRTNIEKNIFLSVIGILCETKTILKYVFLQIKSFVYGRIRTLNLYIIKAVDNNSLKNKKIQYSDIGNRTCKHDLRINPSPLPCRLVYEGTWSTNRSTAFTSVSLSEDSEMSLTSIHVFLQIRQTYWCLCLTDVWHESL
jgi:hypothetical protein